MTVSPVLKKYNIYIIPVHERVKVFSPEDEIEVIELYEEGLTIKEVAETYEVSHTPVRDVLVKHNIPRRQHPYLIRTEYYTKIKEKDYPKVIRLYEKGLTVKEVAKQFKVTPNTISRLLKSLILKSGQDMIIFKK